MTHPFKDVVSRRHTDKRVEEIASYYNETPSEYFQDLLEHAAWQHATIALLADDSVAWIHCVNCGNAMLLIGTTTAAVLCAQCGTARCHVDMPQAEEIAHELSDQENGGG